MTEQDKRYRARPLRHWIRQGSSSMERIRGHARNLNRLQRQLQRRLPDTLAGHWRLAAISANEVTLMAPTPAWAATLRFQQALILREVGKLTGLKPKRCRVVIDPPRQPSKASPRHTPSPETLAELTEAAASQTDERLRASMQRLAHRLAQRHSQDEIESDGE